MLHPAAHHSAKEIPYLSAMASSDGELRKIVAVNLRALMEKRDWTQEQLKAKSGLSQRHISNMLNRKTSTSFERLNAVAGAFGIPGWLLMIPGIDVEILDSQRLPSLIKSYRDAGREGRTYIESVADREAVHNIAANTSKTKVVQMHKSKSG
jgi:transcriptional regulator with XRE-family HTH domain